MKTRYRMEEAELRTLLSGGMVKFDGGAVEVFLADIGFDRIIQCARDAIEKTKQAAQR